MKALQKKVLPAAVSLALGAALGTPGVAQAGWYVGLGGGQANYDDDSVSSSDLSSLESDLEDLGVFVDALSISVDDSDTAYKLFAGYQFNDYFALEGQYVDLGSIEAAISGTINDGGEGSGSFSGSASGDVTGFGVNVVGLLPFLDQFAAFAKVGVTRWDVNADASYSDSFGNSVGLSDDGFDEGIDVNYGVGLKWAITGHLGVQAEWEQYKVSGSDIDLITGSVTWGF